MDKEYLVMISIMRGMLKNGLITDDEFDEINNDLKEKYNPVLEILV